MKLRNKKTGEIVFATMKASYGGGELQIRYYPLDNAEDTQFKEYRSISELNEEWEDVSEEPKEHWYIDSDGEVYPTGGLNRFDLDRMANIGNLFETKEEAEKAVEKLKAWKRLKDKGFKFTSWGNGILLQKTIAGQFRYEFPRDKMDDIEKDLDLLFGGEDE